MCKLMRKITTVLLSVVFAVSLGFVIHQLSQYREAESTHQLSQQLAVKEPITEPVTELPEATVPLSNLPEPDGIAANMLTLDITALQEVNPDVLGWIRIPDTKIDYPLLSGEDNQQYLHTAWDGTANYAGSIYLEAQSSRDLSDFHSLIYGHNMANGSMFGNLILYSEQAFRDAHPYVYLNIGGTVHRYEVFAAYTAGIESDTYRIGFRSAGRKQQAIDYYQETSVISAPRQITPNDRILTLSTCTGNGDYDYRWVVQAVLDTTWSVS